MDDFFKLDLNSSCKWLPANQFLFQLANLFLVFTYFVKPDGIAGLIQLRVALTLAGLCFALWGGTVICSLDCMLWNLAFAIGNAVHLIYLLNKVKSTPFKDKYEEAVYETLFKPINVKKYQFKQLFSVAKQRYLQDGEYYARQNITDSKHISIVARGQFEVLLNGRPVSEINEFEFLNSTEWLAMRGKSTSKYQISLVAALDSVIFEWRKDDLLKQLEKDTILKHLFDSMIGKDICKKLYSFHQTFLLQENALSSEQARQASLLIYSAANFISPNHHQHHRKRHSFSSTTMSPGEFRIGDVLIPPPETAPYSTMSTSVMANNNRIHQENDAIHYTNLSSSSQHRSPLFNIQTTSTIPRYMDVVWTTNNYGDRRLYNGIPSEATPLDDERTSNSIQKLDFDYDDFSASVELSDRLMYSSKSSSLYRDDDDDDDDHDHEADCVNGEWCKSLDRQVLINLKETDL